MTNTNPDQKCITALASICQMFCFWRGDLVFDFQVFPTKYHSGRLLFCFVPGNELIDVTGITLKQATRKTVIYLNDIWLEKPENQKRDLLSKNKTSDKWRPGQLYISDQD